jgi:hypothetical protein
LEMPRRSGTKILSHMVSLDKFHFVFSPVSGATGLKIRFFPYLCKDTTPLFIFLANFPWR